jgi:hypothetical protein
MNIVAFAILPCTSIFHHMYSCNIPDFYGLNNLHKRKIVLQRLKGKTIFQLALVIQYLELGTAIFLDFKPPKHPLC